ncbi:MMPL family transporter [Actinoplanes auranticolor]|uniref:MMPL family transporter n=1 Tax=Actinoplanes auranticolor TaxID=47988 RepID=UPI001FE7C7CB|nr:MMPL family transporter [Actinoplanes auranticolor]
MEEIGVFAAWGSWVARFRWPVLVCTVVAVAAAGMWGLGVFGQLTEGGYNDPGSESTRAAEVVREELGAQGGDVVVIYTPTSGSIDDTGLGQRVRTRLDALPRSAVTAVASYWPDKTAQYASADRSRAVAVLTLAGDDEGAKLEAYREIDDKLSVEGATTQLAGGAPLSDASSTLSTQDLAFAEAVSLPIVLILLLFIFGSLVAASLPVLVGGCAVLGSLGVLHAIAYGHDVNSFAVNVASLLGLGMAIDYGLFMVGRFREEQGFGRTPGEAVARTVATAGRTVIFSATLLMIALAGLLLFPQGFLKSLAYGGLAAVALAAILSLTLLPALLAVLGPRVDKLPVRLPRRGGNRPAGTGWARLAGAVLRHPVLVALPILAGLLVLAAPIAGVRFGENDERILPAGNPARQAIETLKADFPALSSAGVQVVLRGTRGAAPAAQDGTAFADEVRKVPGLAAVTPAGTGGDVLLYTATLTGTDPFSTAARDAVEDIRSLRAPPGAEVLVGGTTARNVDSLSATADQLPLMIALLVGATLVLMFLAFGSILLPVKAVVLSALSLSATFGILVWIFQDGHGADLLRVTPAPPEVGIVVLMAAVVFGLSTDYEVFLLSRMVEARTRGATTAEAVTTGLARTGRVISAAAILLIVVTGAFALSSVTTMRFIGVGMIVALFLDATVVRMLLVPAVLKLTGDAAWWAPGPLRRLQERAGLQEYEDEELFPTVSVGRHAAPEVAGARTSAVAGGRAGAPVRASAWFERPSGDGDTTSAWPPQPAARSVSPATPMSDPSAADAPVAGSSAADAPVSPGVSGAGSFPVTAPVSPGGPGGPGARPDHFSGTASVSPAASPDSTAGPASSAAGSAWPAAGSAAGSGTSAAGLASGSASAATESTAGSASPAAGSADRSASSAARSASPAAGTGSPAAGPAPTAPSGRAGGRFSASAPVSGGATSGYPVAGSAPHPSSSRITLDEPGTGDASWPAASTQSPSVSGERPSSPAPTSPSAPPAWPPAAGRGRADREANGQTDPDGYGRTGHEDGPPVTVDLSGRVTPPDDTTADGGEAPADPGRREPGVDTTAILELPPTRPEPPS